MSTPENPYREFLQSVSSGTALRKDVADGKAPCANVY